LRPANLSNISGLPGREAADIDFLFFMFHMHPHPCWATFPILAPRSVV
jgi:hypothetical protein